MHHTRFVATCVSIVWWGRLPGLRTFPRSVARAKSIQPEEFRRRGYPFCAEGERDGWNLASKGDGQTRRMTMRRERLRIGETDGERRVAAVFTCKGRSRRGLFRGSVPTCRRISIDDLVSSSAPKDGVVRGGAREGTSIRSTRRSRSVERSPLEEIR